MWKLLVSSFFLLICSVAFGEDTTQNAASKSPMFILGVQSNLFYLPRSYSASTVYTLQSGFSKSPGFIRLAVGIPNYTPEVSSPHQVLYSIKGYYVEPGFVYYFGNLVDDRTIFWLSTSLYLASFRHDLALTIKDVNWLTEQKYQYKERMNRVGIKPSFGLMVSLTKQLKLTSGVEFGLLLNDESPFSEIEAFEHASYYTAGLGANIKRSTLLQFGLHYVIN